MTTASTNHLLEVNDSTHPLASELSSLRVAVSRFQDEAYNSSVKLQRHSLESANAHDRAAYLERENSVLRTELSVLRAHPHPDAAPEAHPAVAQVQQLTLSLRRLSDKLSLTESALLERTTQLAHVSAEASKAKLTAEAAYELAARTRGREEAGKLRELELEWKLKQAQESTRMSDLVVKEYADLVRSLEAKHPQEKNLTDGLAEGKLGLQRLLSECSAESVKLQKELLETQNAVAVAESHLESEKKLTNQCRVELAQSQFELQQLKIDDNAAAKMVSRYMKFSQKSTDALSEALTSLKNRHAATNSTLSSQVLSLGSQLSTSQAQMDTLRRALDELGGELAKEAFGRRREVALRIRMVNREEKLRAELERWILKAEEAREEVDIPKMVRYARAIMEGTLGGEAGSIGRLIVAESAVNELRMELEAETARRLELEKLDALERTKEVASENENEGADQNQDCDGRREKSEASSGTFTQKTLIVIPVTHAASTSIPEVHPEIVEVLAPVDVEPSPSNPVPPPTIEVNAPVSELLVPVVNKVATWDQNSKPLPCPPPSAPSIPTDEVVASGFIPSTPIDSLTLPNGKFTETVGHLDVFHGINSNDTIAEPPTTPPLANGSTLQVVVTKALPHTDIPTAPATSPYTNGSALQDRVPMAEAFPHTAITQHDQGLPGLQAPPTSSSEMTGIVHSSSHDSADFAVREEQDEGATVKGPTISGGAEPDSNAQSETDVLPSPPLSTPRNGIVPLQLKPELPSIPSPASTETMSVIIHPPSDIPSLEISSLPAHPLLAKLAQTRYRYDTLGQSLRDCHLALEALSTSITAESWPAGQMLGDAFLTAVQRLREYTEDARVEVEIRKADEALAARGFETLLSVPGALGTSTPHPHQDDQDVITHSDVEIQVEAFVDGSDPSVSKAMRNLSRKLDDIEHDIAVLKRAAHNDSDEALASPPPSTDASTGASWTSWMRGTPASPASPPVSAPGPALTFGSVMTSPRLRHSPSLNFPGWKAADPLASLGLRVPMPKYIHQARPAAIQPRSRTLSTMYMLGLGARRASGSGLFTPSVSPRKGMNLHENGMETEKGETDSESDSDVE